MNDHEETRKAFEDAVFNRRFRASIQRNTMPPRGFGGIDFVSVGCPTQAELCKRDAEGDYADETVSAMWWGWRAALTNAAAPSPIPEGCTPATIIGRLHKKLAKTQKQRDFFRQRCEHYAEVVRLHPYIERDYASIQKRRAERERVKGLEQRITEQAMLIEKLAAAGSAALPPPPPDPVYWQWRHTRDAWSTTFLFTSEPAVTAPDTEKRPLYAGPVIAFGVPPFDASKPCILTTDDPTRTLCLRCMNPHHACDHPAYGGTAAAVPHRESDSVPASGLPAWVDGLRDFMQRNGKTTEEVGNVLVAAGFATRGVPESDSITREQARDAARYRWLRQQHWNSAPLCVVMQPREAIKLGHDCPTLERLDAAVDKAMGVQK